MSFSYPVFSARTVCQREHDKSVYDLKAITVRGIEQGPGCLRSEITRSFHSPNGPGEMDAIARETTSVRFYAVYSSR